MSITWEQLKAITSVVACEECSLHHAAVRSCEDARLELQGGRA